MKVFVLIIILILFINIQVKLTFYVVKNSVIQGFIILHQSNKVLETST